jgi:tetratricopeptide (TPR) repeat protein
MGRKSRLKRLRKEEKRKEKKELEKKGKIVKFLERILPPDSSSPYRLNSKDYLLSLIVFMIAFFVYLKTVAPTVTAEDSGELIAAAYTLGIAHPPGYPIWCLLGKVFTLIPIGSIGYRVNLMSAFFASVSVLLLFFILLKICKNRIASLVGSLSLSFSSTLWSQAVISEVYTLNAFFVCLTFLVLVIWNERREDKYLLLFSFLCGLSLTNHQTMALLFPPYLFYIYSGDPFILKRRKTLSFIVLLFFSALTLYLYLPIRSLTNAPLDWGNPENFKNFLDHILRRQYGSLSKQPHSFPLFFRQLGTYLKSLSSQWTPYVGLIGILGAWRSFKENKRLFLTILLIFLSLSLVTVYLINFKLEREVLNAAEVFYIPSYIMFSLWIGIGLSYLSKRWIRIKGRKILSSFLTFLLLFIPLIPLSSNYFRNDKSKDYFSYNYGMNIFKTLDKNAVIFTSGDYQTFPLTYLQIIEGKREDVTICDIQGDLAKAILGEGYNESAYQRRQKVQDRIILEMMENQNRPVYYLLKRDMENLPGYQLKPVGITYKVMKRGIMKKGEENKQDLGSYWKEYDLTDIDDGSIFKDYTTSLIVLTYHYFLGEYYFQKSEIDKAIKEFDLASGIGEGVKEIYNNLGSALAEKGRYTLAIEQYGKALKIDPEYVMALNNLGNIYKDRGDYKKAVEYYRKVISLEPYRFKAYNHLGYIFLNRGEAEEAEKVWNISLRINPNQPLIKERLNNVSKMKGD